MKDLILIKQHIDGLMQEFGFQTSIDFLGSTFGYTAKKPVLLLSISLATIGTYLENFIGIDPFVYLAFIILLFLEFFTGMRASLKEGKKINPKSVNYLRGRKEFDLDKDTIIKFCDFAVKFFSEV